MRTAIEKPGPTRYGVRHSTLTGFVILLLVGCGETQVAPEHRELILRLATATSTQDSANLKSIEDDVARLTSASAMFPEQSRAFLAIIAMAEQGDWETARDRAYALRDGQKPTARDLEAVASRRLPEMIRPERKQRGKNSG